MVKKYYNHIMNLLRKIGKFIKFGYYRLYRGEGGRQWAQKVEPEATKAEMFTTRQRH